MKLSTCKFIELSMSIEKVVYIKTNEFFHCEAVFEYIGTHFVLKKHYSRNKKNGLLIFFAFINLNARRQIRDKLVLWRTNQNDIGKVVQRLELRQ